ncbi:hypothetical protein SLS53_007945 [Cytospora paraplurivora]|uniref:Uncharacterized protein n=1 Tax=Cytospora paraplurivora TaxID=2898453 RepID=A0AAN9YCP1_9PEZI
MTPRRTPVATANRTITAQEAVLCVPPQVQDTPVSRLPNPTWAATSPEYRHALFSAAQGGHIGCIELLLRATGRPLAEFANEHDELCEKMLCAAARGGHIDVPSLLLDDPQLQLDVNAQGFGAVSNGSALHIAATRGDTALTKILVDRYGADVDLAADESFRKCPYEIAARAGHTETLKFLLSVSAREDAVTNAFHSASRGAQLGIMAWLVARYGAKLPP